MSDQRKPITEFEYADRLAEILASLQSEVMHPVRSRLGEIIKNADKSKVASEAELAQRTDQITQGLKEALQNHDDKNTKLVEKRRAEEDSRSGLIRHYKKSLADIRNDRSRIQGAFQAKGLRIPADETGPISTSRLDDSNLDDLLRDGSRLFEEAHQVLSGPLSRFDASRFHSHIFHLVIAFGGFATCIGMIFILITPSFRLNFPVYYIFWALVVGICASYFLKASLDKQKEKFFDLLEYPSAKKRAVAAYVKWREYMIAIEKIIPKRLEKLEFEKRSKLGESDRSLAENKDLFEQTEARLRSDQMAVEQQHQARLERITSAARNAKVQLTQEFLPRVAEKHRMVNSFWKQTLQASAEWSDSVWHNWQPDPSPEFAARLGKLVLEDNALAGEFQDLSLRFELPALMPFADGRFLLFETKSNARPYVEAIQSLMLRALANVPPGKMRFTFIDPVGLGQSVAPFMALGDLDEQLISGRAWSESQHIEQQLGKLTEHMEMVIQKYLRSDYASIRDYNHTANEVAEPFRVLAIFDFPTNFSDSAIHRLVSIIRNGPRCGIFTLLVRNTTKPLPYGFNFDAELRPLAFTPYHQLAH